MTLDDLRKQWAMVVNDPVLLGSPAFEDRCEPDFDSELVLHESGPGFDFET